MLGSDEERRQRQQQQQRSEDVAVLERKAKEQELHAREQELEARSRELDRERARLQSLREDDAPGPLVMRPRERRTSLRHQLQRPLSQMELGDALDGAIARQKAYTSAQQQLAPPPPLSPVKPLASPTRGAHSPLPSPRARERRPASPGTSTSSGAGAGHAANCGCEMCSVSKYSAPPQGVHQRVDSKPDKPRSWMRRLSMPVGNALGLDSAKRSQAGAGAGLPGGGGTTNFSLGSGVGNTPAGGRGLFSMDGKKNASTTALSSRSPDNGLGVREDGKAVSYTRGGGLIPGRKSYEMGGISNRSMTNLGITGRH